MAQSDLENEDVFTKPTAPRSDWEAFKWMFFEPSLLIAFSKKISEKDAHRRFPSIYIKFIIPLTLLSWILFITVLVWFNIPNQYPTLFKFDISSGYSSSNFAGKCFLLTSNMAVGLVVGLIFGWAVGLGGVLGGGLAVGLAVSLAVGLSGGLTGGLTGGLPEGLTKGLIEGLIEGISEGLARGLTSSITVCLAYGLAQGLTLGLFFGLTEGFAFGLFVCLVVFLVVCLALGLTLGLTLGMALGLILCLAFCIMHFRLIFYPFYGLSILKKSSLKHNPYLNDEVIWLPMPWVKRALLKETKEDPALALRFVNFLLRYRPLQSGLAFEIEHTATASLWQNLLRLESNSITLNPFGFFNKSLVISKKKPKWVPSINWVLQLFQIREALTQAELQTAVVLKKQYLEQCAALVQDLQKIQLRETFRSREVYFPVFEHWQKILDNQIREITQEVERIHSVSLNPYSKGNALAPGGVTGSSLFIEREDLKSELSLKIQTAAVMPTFLLLGQRRTGKTSLLNFLPQMLDKSRYAVAVIDAQSMSGELSVPAWFSAWRDRVRAIFGLPPEAEPLPKDWLEAWDAFSAFLLELAQTNSRKIILCMEEYDESQGFHNALRQDTERGAALLARIRAFSQRQNEVILMFVGATDFIDLPGEPRWSKYFVQIHIFRVEYLSRAGSLKLITEPVPGFRLQYAEGLPERIWELTQGHPHLLHSICSDLVDYANATPKNPVDHADLDKILGEKTLQRGEQPFVGFWDEFCQNQSMRDVVLEITRHRPVDRALPDVRRLVDYKYVVEDAKGNLRMRVPLFEQWLVRFGY